MTPPGSSTSPTLPFLDGHEIPQLGYGVYKVGNDEAAQVVELALRAGYRHVDTAKLYGNEEGVGRAVRASDLAREDLFLTTKLWNDEHPHDLAVAAFDASLQRLGMDYVDLYLIHWAKPHQGQYLEAWRALIEIKQSGRSRSIGVSNFPKEQLQEIIDATGTTPVIHQIELHPYLQQQELRAFHQEHGILTEAWSPLGRGAVLEDPVITEIARSHGATPAQVIIAWHLAIGNVVIPKSVTPSRITENVAALDLQLTEEDLAVIATLDKGEDGRVGSNPAA
jgi:2,5-diketo-D-gluconate reductase A